jgi:HSP20 family protein
MTLRYRHLGSRYTMIVRRGALPPFSEAWRLERLTVTLAEPCWRPETDVYETAGAIHLAVALAGVDRDDVQITLFEDALVIEGQRRLACEGEGVYRAAQIPQGPFRVEVALTAAIAPEGLEGRYEHGLLRLTLRKAAAR